MVKTEEIDAYWRRIKQHKLITNAAAYISGHIVQKAIAFLLLPLWVRFLTPEDYGITGTLTAYAGVLSALLLMGLHGAAVRHYFDTDDLRQQKSYISTVILFQVVVSLIVVLILDTLGATLWEQFTANIIPFDPYVRLMLWTTFTAVTGQIPLAVYRAQQKAKEYVFIQYGKFLVGVVASLILVVALKWGAYGVMLSQFIAGAVFVIVVLYLAFRNWFTWHLEWGHIRVSLGYGLPLVPHMLAGWVLAASDRLILERYVSLAELGLYNLGYQLGMVMSFLVTGINQAWSPYYFRLMKTTSNPEHKIIKAVSIYMTLIGGICLAGVLFTAEIIYILLPDRYYGATPYVGPVLLGYLANGLYYFASMPLFYHKKTKTIPVLTASAAILNIFLNLWLIPLYGAIAAAWTTTIAFGFLFLVFLPIGRRYQKIDYPFAQYGALLSIIIVSTLIVPQLSVLGLKTELIKIALLTIYAVLAYVMLILPYMKRNIRFGL